MTRRLSQMKFDLFEYIQRHREWPDRTFGPGPRPLGVIDHIRKELIEIEQSPTDVTEWVDVIILAIDGATRAGHSAQVVANALSDKQKKNKKRTWLDWRTADPDKAICHVGE